MRLSRPRTGRQWAIAVAAGVLLAGAAFWLIAPYNIAASIPHAPGVRALLHGYLLNAVRTWSLGIEPPDYIDLDDPALAALGAAHFETGCAPCHGAPGRARNPVVLGMRPEPPDLAGVAARFADRELYWIALNGFKYTGMPAWPAQQRAEEPWALAAFLRRYDGLDAASYRELAYGDVRASDPAAATAMAFGALTGPELELVDTCARCHGDDGLGRGGVAPRLAGQSRAYLLATLDAFAEGSRPSGFMQPLASALSPLERERLVDHFARLPAGSGAGGGTAPAPEALLAAGARLAASGDPQHDVPSCLACHGPGDAAERRPVFPQIAGQDQRWLETWLRHWRERELGGTEFAHVMHRAARTLTDDQIRALAVYFAAAAPPAAAQGD